MKVEKNSEDIFTNSSIARRKCESGREGKKCPVSHIPQSSSSSLFFFFFCPANRVMLRISDPLSSSPDRFKGPDGYKNKGCNQVRNPPPLILLEASMGRRGRKLPRRPCCRPRFHENRNSARRKTTGKQFDKILNFSSFFPTKIRQIPYPGPPVAACATARIRLWRGSPCGSWRRRGRPQPTPRGRRRRCSWGLEGEGRPKRPPMTGSEKIFLMYFLGESKVVGFFSSHLKG